MALFQHTQLFFSVHADVKCFFTSHISLRPSQPYR